MKSKDIRRMLSEARELTPSDHLKQRILDEALPPQHATVPSAKERKPAFWRTRRMATLVASVLVCLILTGTGLGVYGMETETVYLDVNPSVELTLNLFGRVINVQYMNADAKQSLSEAKLKQMTVEDALDTILTIWGDQGYLENAELNITVVAKDARKSESLLSALEKKAEACRSDHGYSMEITGNRASREDREAAKESGLSPAKYQLIREIRQRSDAYSEAQLSAMSMQELRKIIKELDPGSNQESRGEGNQDRADTEGSDDKKNTDRGNKNQQNGEKDAEAEGENPKTPNQGEKNPKQGPEKK